MYLQSNSLCIKNLYQKAACYYFPYIKIPLPLTLFPEFSVSPHLQLSQGGELINGKYAFLPGREKIIQILGPEEKCCTAIRID